MPIDTTNSRTIDLGCGPNKVADAYGVDIHPYDGVDQVFDLNSMPWPLSSNSFKHIYARHVIEHVADISAFINEVHRIGMDGAIVEIVTPHFSSLDSWEDPTHRWHLASGWHKTFTQRYLSEQVLPFEHIKTDVGFSKSLWTRLGWLISKLASIEYWEKHFAFVFRGRNISTQLKIVKADSAG